VLAVADQTLTGNFTFEEENSATPAARKIKVAADTVSLTLGDLASPLVQLRMRVASYSLPHKELPDRSAVASANVNVPDLFSGNFAVAAQVNSLTGPVNETVGGAPLVLPGPFLRVEVVVAPANAIFGRGWKLSAFAIEVKNGPTGLTTGSLACRKWPPRCPARQTRRW
jgi:hypothetical protein